MEKSGHGGTAVRLGNMGDLIVSELHGRYYESAYRRNRFYAANPTGVTTLAYTSGTTVTDLGICLSNPVGNTFNLVVDKIGVAFPVINTTVNTAIVAVGYNSSTNVTHTTALTPGSLFVGVGPTPTGKVDSSFTVPTALITAVQLISMGSATTLPTQGLFDLEGSIVLPPGAYLVVTTTAASPASGFQASIFWEEVPV